MINMLFVGNHVITGLLCELSLGLNLMNDVLISQWLIQQQQ